jgi:hypothetical protein
VGLFVFINICISFEITKRGMRYLLIDINGQVLLEDSDLILLEKKAHIIASNSSEKIEIVKVIKTINPTTTKNHE